MTWRREKQAMTPKKIIRNAVLVLAMLSCIFVSVWTLKASSLQLEGVRLPPGFQITTYATGVRGARQMCMSPSGILFVGMREVKGSVYALVDRDKDGKVDKAYLVARNLLCPNGVDFKDGSLYISVVHGVYRLDNIEKRLDNPPEPVPVNLNLPREMWHGQKYIRFGPDGLLYVPVGAWCNVCEKDDWRFASIMRMRPDGSKLEVFAKGIRNTVGFDWHPTTKELWFTDNGRDYLGDDLPPDELNRAPRKGMHFGFPYRYGLNAADPDFGKKGSPAAEYTPCAVPLGAHVAALGVRFYTGRMFPKQYHNQIFIAEHGSWNRSKPIGYRISLVTFPPDGPPKYSVFAEGWLRNGSAWGRPVDVIVAPDGALLVSDDHAGAIYRITYGSAPGAVK
ncbi:MAG TPA: PQQ-dependent sugar dehydrogenase [Candidatus Obscuribacterales bacterium]